MTVYLIKMLWDHSGKVVNQFLGVAWSKEELAKKAAREYPEGSVKIYEFPLITIDVNP